MGSNPGSDRKSTTAPRALHSLMCGCPLLQVCTLGWVKCREHISLLIILCIIVYVTNKAYQSLICIVFESKREERKRGRVFVAEEKQSEMRWRRRLYSQTPIIFWWAMAACIAICLCAAAEPLVRFLVLHEPMEEEKGSFPHTASLDTVRVKYRKGTSV